MGNWNWFWNYADWVVVPGSTALEPVELVRGRKPNNTAGSPTMIGTRYGRAINGVDSQIIRYTLPDGGAGLFTRANSWSAFGMVTHENTTEQPCFWGQSGYGGDALLRRANIRINATQTQGSRTVDFGFSNGGSVQTLASLDGTWSPGEPVIAMCSHVAGSSNINAFSYNLTTKKFVASLDAGGSAWTADGSNDAELQILAHYDVDNDPISGPFHYFAFLDNYVMSEGNARQLANDPFGWAYSRKRFFAFKYPTTEAPTGDITVQDKTATATGTAITDQVDLTIIPGAAAETGTATTQASLTLVNPTASGTGTAINPTVSIATVVTNPTAAGTGTAITDQVDLNLIPTAASSTGTAITDQVDLTLIPTAATGTGTAVNPTVTLAVTITNPTATATGTAITDQVDLTLIPTASTGTGTAITDQVDLTIIPGAATGTGTAVNPTVDTTGGPNPSTPQGEVRVLMRQAGPVVYVEWALGAAPADNITVQDKTATGTGTATVGQVDLTIIPTAATGTGTAVADQVDLTIIPTAATGTGTAVNPTVTIAIAVVNPTATGTGTATVDQVDLAIIPAAATATGTAITDQVDLVIIPTAATGTGTAINPSVQLSGIQVPNPTATGTGTATVGQVDLTIIPAAATGTGTATAVSSWTIIPTAAQATGTAVNPTVTIAVVVTNPTASATATATATATWSITPPTATGTATATATFLWTIIPPTASGTGTAINPLVNTGTDRAYAIVLEGFSFYFHPNRAFIRSQEVVDTDLTEFSVTPNSVSWPNNRPRFNAYEIAD